MPGLEINAAKIRQYLTGLTSHMLNNYVEDVVHRFCLVNPSSILKIHHDYEDEEDYIEEEE